VNRPTNGASSVQIQDAIGTPLDVLDMYGGDFDPQVLRTPTGTIVEDLVDSVVASLEGFSSIEQAESVRMFDDAYIRTPGSGSGSDMFDVLTEDPVIVVKTIPTPKIPTPKIPTPKIITPKKKPVTPVVKKISPEEQNAIAKLEQLLNVIIPIAPKDDTIQEYNETITEITEFIDAAKAAITTADNLGLYMTAYRTLIDNLDTKLGNFYSIRNKLTERSKDVIVYIAQWLDETNAALTIVDDNDALYYNAADLVWQGSILKVTSYRGPYRDVYRELKKYRKIKLEQAQSDAAAVVPPKGTDFGELAKKLKASIDGLLKDINVDKVTNPQPEDNDDMRDILFNDPNIHKLLYWMYELSGAIGAYVATGRKVRSLGKDRIAAFTEAKDALVAAIDFYERVALGEPIVFTGPRHKRPEVRTVGREGTQVRLYKRTEGMFMTRDFLKTARNSGRGNLISGAITFTHDGGETSVITIVDMDEKMSRVNTKARKGVLDYFYPLHNLGGRMGLGPARYIDKYNTSYYTYAEGKAYIGIPKKGTVEVDITGGRFEYSYDLDKIGTPAKVSRFVYSRKPFSFLLRRDDVGILVTTTEGVDTRKWSKHIKISSIVLTVY